MAQESRREQLERELAELDAQERAAAGTIEPAASREAAPRSNGHGSGRAEADDDPRVDTCPNCGGTFVRAPRFDLARRNDQGNARERERFIAARERVDAERGELQQCSGCGYQRRANDKIRPAKAG